MLIGTNWKIEATELNVTLYQKKKRKRKKTGEVYEVWEVHGYYGTVQNALHALVNQGVRDTKLRDLKTVCDKVDKLHALIQNAILSVPERQHAP